MILKFGWSPEDFSNFKLSRVVLTFGNVADVGNHFLIRD